MIKRDPGYLKRNNIRVIDSSGREVDPRSVNWSRYGAGRLPPYQLRQDPGDDNALGLVKIMFPNQYSVYLHDTPSKSLFDKDERTFSSGCIRVQKAFELAELVLDDPSRWNQATMAEVVAAKAMKTVNLAKPVPVLMLYWTAQPTPDGQVLFRNDIYGARPAHAGGAQQRIHAAAVDAQEKGRWALGRHRPVSRRNACGRAVTPAQRPPSVRISITRRLSCRPSAVALSATGSDSPMPIACIRDGLTPREAR